MKIPLEKIIFLDIETVPQAPSYQELSEDWKKMWDKKSQQLDGEKSPEQMYQKAGIYAEFGKVVAVVLARIEDQEIRYKTFADREEKIILDQLHQVFSKFSADQYYLCAHNGKEFDFPFLGRRFLAHGFSVPAILDLQNKKPWEIQHLDTLHLWRFGDYKHYISLELLAMVLGISHHKETMSGAEVAPAFYEEKNLEKIANYCQQDVALLIEVYQKITKKN